jgi:hypothetical protein
MISDDVIKQSAREVVDRLGEAAIEYMHVRIAEFERGGKPKEQNQAYLMLSAVEDIVEERSF